MRLHPARAAGLLCAPWTPAWAKDELSRRARAVPSLDLRFAENKSLVDSVSGQSLITFTRASTGTYVDSDGVIRSAANDAPRFDHNPLTGECLGLLVEEQRQNLLLQSEDFSTTWSKGANATITPNYGTAPNGTATADRLELPTGVSTFVSQVVATVSGTAYVFSVYARATSGNSEFTMLLGTASQSFILTETWQRISVSFTATSGSTTAILDNGVTAADVLVWGAQLEAGAFPTSYIPTTTAAVTRTADLASITTAGGNVRSLFTSFRSPASGTRPVVSLDDNTANERIEILTSGTDPKLLVTDGGSAVADLNGGTVTANVLARIAARFSTDDYAVSINGSTSQLDAAGALPTVNRIRIGSNQAGGYLSGPIARVTAWDSTLPLLPSISQ
jgi:hypothetical protein